MMSADGEVIHLNQIREVELEFKTGVDRISLVTTGENGDGISHFLSFGMMILDGDKEV
jgi:hypothetical protein